MRFVDNVSELVDPQYLEFRRLHHLKNLPNPITTKDFLDLETKTLSSILREIFSLIENHNIQSLHRDIVVEQYFNPAHPTYAEYEEDEDGYSKGIGEPTGSTESAIGILIQFMGSRY